MEGRIDEISVYSVDSVSYSIEDLLCAIIAFLYECSVWLTIENMGVRLLCPAAWSRQPSCS